MPYSHTAINRNDQGFEDLVFDLIAKLIRRFWIELSALALTALSWALLATKINPLVAVCPVILIWAAMLKSRRFRRWFRLMGSTARIRERVRSGLLHCGGLGAQPSVYAASPTPSGWRISLQMARGTSVQELERDQNTLEVALRCRSVRIMPSHKRADLVDLLISNRDPFQTMPPAAPVRSGDPKDPVEIELGVDELGNPVVLDLYDNHVLIGGVTGSGKSVVMSQMVAAAAMRPRVALCLLDGKGVELAYFRDAAAVYSSGDVAEAIKILTALREVMHGRFDWLASNRRRKLELGDRQERAYLVIDELATYLNNPDKKLSQLFASLLSDLLARGRAAGITIIAATQRPSIDLVPSHIRDNFSYRIAMRTTTRDASDTILGAGWATRGVNAAEIPASPKGVGYLLAEDGLPLLFRSHYLDDDQLKDLGLRAKAVREGKDVVL